VAASSDVVEGARDEAAKAERAVMRDLELVASSLLGTEATV